VTTRPPAAFSSLTASAYRLTQSSTVSGSRIAASGAGQFACSDGARRETCRPPGRVPVLADAAGHAGLHGGPDLAQAGDRTSSSLRQARSFSSISCAMLRPAAAQRASSSSPLLNG
jgi:hypothetical protein